MKHNSTHGVGAGSAARLWIVEYGAVGLPLGNPSRLTTFEAHDTEAEARAAMDASEFNARMFVVTVPPDGIASDGSQP